MDAETIGRLMTSWCAQSWGPLRLELRRAEAERWTIAAAWTDGREVEIEGALRNNDPPLLVLERTTELTPSDLPGVNLNEPQQAFAVRSVVERTLATRPWLLAAESDIRGSIRLELSLWLSAEALDPNVFAAAVAELVKVPLAIRWACLQLAGTPVSAGAAPAASAAGARPAKPTPPSRAPEPPPARVPEPPPVRRAEPPPARRPEPPAPPPPARPPIWAPPTPAGRRPPAQPAEPAQPAQPAQAAPSAPAAGEAPSVSEAPPPQPASDGAAITEVQGFCSECGKPYRPGHKFCMACGARVQ